MRKAENLNITVATDKIQCVKCVWSGGNPFNINCCKFKFKPSPVLYENEKCPKFEELEENDDDI